MNTETLDLCRQAAETVLENMFFETLIEPPAQGECPAEALRAEASFSGTEYGSLQVAVRHNLARRLASNLLGQEDRSVTLTQIENTLLELANIYCGCLMSRARPQAKLTIGSPVMVYGSPSDREWIRFPLVSGDFAVSLRWEHGAL